MFCRRRARSVRYCERSEASRMSRFRYICGGEEGRLASASEVGKGVVIESSVLSRDGAGDDDLDVTDGTDVPGGGAPLTN